MPQEQNLEDAPSRSCGSWRCVELDEILENRVPQEEQGLGNMCIHIIYIYTCTQIRQTANVIYIYVIIYAIICNMYITYIIICLYSERIPG